MVKTNEEIYKFVKLIEDEDSREKITNFLLEMYAYACPAKAIGKLLNIASNMNDNLLIEWYYDDTREFILEAFKEIPLCKYSKECIFYYGIIKSNDDLIIREPFPDREDIMHLNLIGTIINGFLIGGWNCTKIKDGIFRYGSQDLMFNIYDKNENIITGYDKTIEESREKVDKYLKKK